MPLTNKTIVAIDDALPIVNFLRISLETLGVKFYSATTAMEGLALCQTHKPDVIILDLGLPDKEGFDILPELNTLYAPEIAPVIVLTVRNSQESRDRAAELGARHYLTKPFGVDRFLAIICSVLNIDKPLFPSVSGLLTDETLPYVSTQGYYPNA